MGAASDEHRLGLLQFDAGVNLHAGTAGVGFAIKKRQLDRCRRIAVRGLILILYKAIPLLQDIQRQSFRYFNPVHTRR